LRDDSVYLTHIDEGVALVRQYVRAGRAHFLADVGNQDQVIRRLETIADATAKLSDELKARHADVPWDQIRGFCNRMAHGYLDLDLERVWDAVEGLSDRHQAVRAELHR